MKLFIKWSFLVSLSGIAGIIGGLINEDITTELAVGMFLGILTFIFIYYAIDKSLIKRNLEDRRKSLILAVKIKMALQLIPFIDALAGAASLNIASAIVHKGDSELLYIYLTTILTGVALSWVVGVIFFIVRLISKNLQPSAVNAISE
ncbi:hypothetical protein Q4524_06750 [Alteromonas stellipolaris]|jgi:uncharacterized membrane protein YfcA|uniref:Uncharacterized protein n=1 Tax=Alteromonas stellipolaris TaxID=233316 RepID=A0AAW7YZR0_9ALTE|nr:MULTISPECIES: hypothetical protein [Alteromonas]AMJ92474.1 hypothetical protein AV940_19470 [Alteromonas sp. Mac2]AMJ96324.1 hypothetical protein AVL56_19715 [Alteromonas stellipolaris]ANB20665.1 hypothetical protein A6K25_04835 [Alteromonas stellipolaris]ANB25463.1 hypothetical protein A6F57_09760 [Alteromonas stellipolaris]MCQ8848575.1 hypothetical protein [Alteromonas stellipolaris]